MNRVYFENLYENVIEKHAQNAIEFNAIVGYSSANFIQFLLRNYNHLKINVFLGMTSSGITESDHNAFISLVKENKSRLSIYYQIYTPPTHRKCYQFIFKDLTDITFLGSSNLSNSGFFSNNEVLAEVEFDMDQLISEQRKKSIDCTKSDLSRYVKLYSSKSMLIEPMEEENKNLFKTVPSIQNLQNRRLSIPHKTDLNFFNRFSIPVMRKDDPRSLRGINKKLRGGDSYLQDSPGSNFIDFFPANIMMRVFIEDYSFELLMYMKTGSRNRVYWENLDMYDFFSEVIGLNSRKEIKYSDLLNNGIEKMYFERISEVKYKANFSTPYH